MADQASSSITIAAPAEKVLGVIADIPSYPQWTGQIKSASVVEEGPCAAPAERLLDPCRRKIELLFQLREPLLEHGEPMLEIRVGPLQIGHTALQSLGEAKDVRENAFSHRGQIGLHLRLKQIEA